MYLLLVSILCLYKSFVPRHSNKSITTYSREISFKSIVLLCISIACDVMNTRITVIEIAYLCEYKNNKYLSFKGC